MGALTAAAVGLSALGTCGWADEMMGDEELPPSSNLHGGQNHPGTGEGVKGRGREEGDMESDREGYEETKAQKDGSTRWEEKA